MENVRNTENEQGNFVNLTQENIGAQHLSCIIRSKTTPPGVALKKAWLKERLNEGHVFRKLDEKATAFIEYAPLESAWVPVAGDDYLYIYCLWTVGEYRGKGYGKSLLDYAVNDAKQKNKAGLCVLSHKKPKTWLTDRAFLIKNGFEVADATQSGYEVLALSFNGAYPRFCDNAKRERIATDELTVYYTDQCPYIYRACETVKTYCAERGIPVRLIKIETLRQAKELPCPFNNFAIFYKGRFETVNLPDLSYLQRILKK